MDTGYSTFTEASEHAKRLEKQGKSTSVKRSDDAWIVRVEGSVGADNENIGHKSICVRRFTPTGAIVVFDYTLRIKEVDTFFGYVAARDLMRQFDSKQIDVSYPVSGEERDVAIEKYLGWKKQNTWDGRNRM